MRSDETGEPSGNPLLDNAIEEQSTKTGDTKPDKNRKP